MSILDYFPGQPRLVQEEILSTIEREWSNYDVFCIQAPVASGKSRVAATLAYWSGAAKRGTAIVTPTNMLTDQYTEEFSEFASVYGQQHYYSLENWQEAVTTAKYAGYLVGNYWAYRVNQLYREVLVVDEAHNLLPMLTANYGIRLWQHEHHWPDHIETTADLIHWIETASHPTRAKLARVEGMKEVLKTRGAQHVTQKTTRKWRGQWRPVLELLTLDARNRPPIMWPKGVNKIILMSATINHNDIYDLNLDQRRVLYIPCESPIPAVNRPFFVEDVAFMSAHNYKHTTPRLADKLDDLMQRNQGKGLIHCTYGLADRLQADLVGRDRVLFHDKQNKSRVFREWQNSTDKVLVASGMYEGIDLPYDKARWQAICKVPFVSLAEVAVQEKMRQRPEAYAWWAIRDVLQATGRVCRTPTDRGATYMLDSHWPNLASKYKHLLPEWFRTAVR